MTVSVKFYTKPKCSLCDDVRILLSQLKKENPLNIKEVNILDDPNLYEKYKYEIPVLLFPDGSELKGRIGSEELRKKILLKKL
jgi:thiol-disulfide isomerase/thioredoxin